MKRMVENWLSISMWIFIVLVPIAAWAQWRIFASVSLCGVFILFFVKEYLARKRIVVLVLTLIAAIFAIAACCISLGSSL